MQVHKKIYSYMITSAYKLSLKDENYIIQSIAEHRATQHPLFFELQKRARRKTLTKKQFKIFRHIMFSRIHLTLPHIALSLQSALMLGQRDVIQTCFKNLCEELSLDTPHYPLSHAHLLEQALNTIGLNVFSLEPTTLRDSFNNPITSEEIIYRNTVRGLYEKSPIIASLVQELSSGGFNNNEQSGMMANFYRAILEIYKSNAQKVTQNKFKLKVLPYFTYHLEINPDLSLAYGAQGTEFLHGQRALKDFLEYHHESRLQEAILSVNAFLDTQNILFNKTLTLINQ